jgi:hypothetical protein
VEIWYQGVTSLRLAKVLALLALAAAFSSGLQAAITTPELDPGSVVSVGMLLGGMLLVIRGRKK